MGIRSIFDGLYVDQLFQKDERGETVFYPHGLMGRGYRLSAEREPCVRRSMRRLMAVSLVVGISFGLLAWRAIGMSEAAQPMSWMIGIGAFVLLIGLVAYLQSRLAEGLEPVSGPRPSIGEWLRAGRRVRALWTHWACIGLGLFGLLMAGAGFALGLADGDPWGFAFGRVHAAGRRGADVGRRARPHRAHEDRARALKPKKERGRRFHARGPRGRQQPWRIMQRR